MKIKFNHRNNGACPLCRKFGRCPVHAKIMDSIGDLRDPEGSGMEMVIYVCPMFKEKV